MARNDARSPWNRRTLAGGALVWAALLVPSGACDDHVIGHGAPIGTACLRDPPLSWENFGDGIIGRHCRGCHSVYVREGQRGDAPLGVDFDSWEDVLTWADRIQARTVDDTTMPPAGGMVPTERLLIGEWMRCEVFPALGQVDLVGTGEGDGT